jgi:hypothetical protein
MNRSVGNVRYGPHIRSAAARYACCCAALICASVLSWETSWAQAVSRRGVTWVSPTDSPLQLNGYEVKEVAEPNGPPRAYIKRDGDRKWIPFFVPERYVLLTLGNRRRLVLINDCPATKFCKVMIADLASHESRQVDQAAVEMYRRGARPDNRVLFIPQASAFSPDDQKVLIKMELIYISVPGESRQLAERLSRNYKSWWYVVDSMSGQVSREYRARRIPRRWWAS